MRSVAANAPCSDNIHDKFCFCYATQVYLGLDMELGQLMAVKQLGLSHMGATGARGSEHEAAVRRVEKEVNFYRRLSHPHIVRYLVRARGQTRGMQSWPTTMLARPVR